MFYCAMAILYDRAVHIHIDWILDVLDLRHNIKFQLVAVFVKYA